jgi:hypothetical protein
MVVSFGLEFFQLSCSWLPHSSRWTWKFFDNLMLGLVLARVIWSWKFLELSNAMKLSVKWFCAGVHRCPWFLQFFGLKKSSTQWIFASIIERLSLGFASRYHWVGCIRYWGGLLLCMLILMILEKVKASRFGFNIFVPGKILIRLCLYICAQC